MSSFQPKLSVFIIILWTLNFCTAQKRQQKSEPINIGIIFSLPWDISNTLRAPLGGPLSLVLASVLACAMFFGLVSAPLTYLFGTPPRPYGRTLNSLPTHGNSTLVESLFHLMPQETGDENCTLLMICHAHGFLPLLPSTFINLYRLFGMEFHGIPKDVEFAIKTGLRDQGDCSKLYNHCGRDIVSISRSVVYHLIPKGVREHWQLRMV